MSPAPRDPERPSDPEDAPGSREERRSPAEDDRESSAPLAERRIEGHLVQKLPKQEGVRPPHVEFFTEESPDGFAEDEPRFVAFCPDCGAKLMLEEHEDCPFFGGSEVDEKGFVIAVHCGLPPGTSGKRPPRKA
jgi:hypothetical protein